MPSKFLQRRCASIAASVVLLSFSAPPQAALAAGKIVQIDETSLDAAQPVAGAGFPDIALVHYAENSGRGSFMDIRGHRHGDTACGQQRRRRNRPRLRLRYGRPFAVEADDAGAGDRLAQTRREFGSDYDLTCRHHAGAEIPGRRDAAIHGLEERLRRALRRRPDGRHDVGRPTAIGFSSKRS